MGRTIAMGAVLIAGLFCMSLKAVTNAPGIDAPGEAYTSLFGITIHRVTIPPAPDGETVLPVERITDGYLKSLAIALLSGGLVGGYLGYVWWKARSRFSR